MKYRVFFFLYIQAIIVNAQIAEIPFALQDNGHIHLKVKVNDFQESLNFVFDTGATADLLGIKIAEKLGIKGNYKQSIPGAGGVKSYDIALNQKLSLSEKITIDNSNLVLTDLSRFHDVSDSSFDGIIGYSILRNHITWINYQEKKLSLYKEINNINLIDYHTIPFKFHRGIPIPQFDISIKLKNGEIFSGRILFDSGAGLTLLVNTPFNKKNKLSDKFKKSIVSRSENLSKMSSSEKVAIASLTLGGFTFEDLTITLSDDTSGVSSYDGYLGIMGAKIIKRFHVILDYSSKKLYLKPNQFYKKKFDFPLSGIRLKRKDQNIIVDYVDKSSPAKKLGLKVGDKIISINNNSTQSIRTYKRLLKKEGSTVILKVMNASSEIKTYTFQLNKLL
jgi:hypothetical protein